MNNFQTLDKKSPEFKDNQNRKEKERFWLELTEITADSEIRFIYTFTFNFNSLANYLFVYH